MTYRLYFPDANTYFPPAPHDSTDGLPTIELTVAVADAIDRAAARSDYSTACIVEVKTGRTVATWRRGAGLRELT